MVARKKMSIGRGEVWVGAGVVLLPETINEIYLFYLKCRSIYVVNLVCAGSAVGQGQFVIRVALEWRLRRVEPKDQRATRLLINLINS